MHEKLLAGLLLITLIGSLRGAESSRLDLNINREWKFELGDHPVADAPGIDDSGWNSTNLPHSFDLPSFKSKDFYAGYG